MKQRAWLVLSLAGNAVLAALLLHAWRAVKPDPAPAGDQPSPRVIARMEHKSDRTLAGVATAALARVVRSADTNALPEVWSRVAVADYQQFADNLRALGMPEETVRDIVMLDLFKSLGEELGGLARRLQKPFWQVDAYSPKPPLVTGEVQNAVTQLTALSQAVLGIDPQTWFLDRWGWVEPAASGDYRNFEPVSEMFEGIGSSDGYDWLPPDRLRELQLLKARQTIAQRESLRRLQSAGNDAERERLNRENAQLEADHERALDEFLTAGERRERALREDGDLRRHLAGVEVSREEYEQLHDLARTSGASNAPYFREGTPEAAQALGLLGAARFAEFQRGADEKYGRVLGACASAGIPSDLARRLDDIRRACERNVKDGMPILAARNAAVEASRALVGEKYTDIQGHVAGWLPRFTTYQLKPGDTLESVAARYKKPVEQIMSASGIAPGATLQPGQAIQIPRD